MNQHGRQMIVAFLWTSIQIFFGPSNAMGTPFFSNVADEADFRTELDKLHDEITRATENCSPIIKNKVILYLERLEQGFEYEWEANFPLDWHSARDNVDLSGCQGVTGFALGAPQAVIRFLKKEGADEAVDEALRAARLAAAGRVQSEIAQEAAKSTIAKSKKTLGASLKAVAAKCCPKSSAIDRLAPVLEDVAVLDQKVQIRKAQSPVGEIKPGGSGAELIAKNRPQDQFETLTAAGLTSEGKEVLLVGDTAVAKELQIASEVKRADFVWLSEGRLGVSEVTLSGDFSGDLLETKVGQVIATASHLEASLGKCTSFAGAHVHVPGNTQVGSSARILAELQDNGDYLLKWKSSGTQITVGSTSTPITIRRNRNVAFENYKLKFTSP